MRLLPAIAAVFAGIAPLRAQQPDAAAMVRGIRLSATLQEMDLKGSVRKSDGKPAALHLFVRNENMQFNLGSGERFHIRMGDEKAELLNIIDDKGTTRPFPVSKLSTPIAGTDASYEDLTLRFLYWPNAKLEGEERVNDADCYKIRLDNKPDEGGAYGVVYVWVHKKYGAFWQVRAHDRKGNAIKEFQVKDVMKLPGDKGYTIQQMRVNALDDNGRVKSITYLEFEKPSASPPPPRRK